VLPTSPKIVRYTPCNTDALRELALSPILKRVYINRGITQPEDLDVDLKGLMSYENLTDISTAADLLYEALRENKRIVIVGDYDVDGATSVAIMMKGLCALGANSIDYLMPDRLQHGYGLTTDIVQLAIEKQAELIVTVDNGIASVDAVDAANHAGIQVLITDHHLPPLKLPAAAAIVNPAQLNDVFQSKHLAGVGVAFYVLLALRAKLRSVSWFDEQNRNEPNFADYLDLVALGTVSDLVPLDKNNRVLVHQGLRRIRAGKCCAGIKALCQISRRAYESLTADDISYALAPRLNAAGRIGDMSLGVNCLLAETEEEAEPIANQLEALNQQRKTIGDEMRHEAFAALDPFKIDSKELPKGLCVIDSKWHTGLSGILAARLKEKFQRPVVVFAYQNENEIKGSGRSIEGIHLRNVLSEIDLAYPGLIDKFGGHAMAAGLSLKKENYEQFAHAFDEAISRRFEKRPFEQRLMSDGELNAGDFNLDLAESLKYGLPWGMGFAEPLFDGRFRLLEQRLLQQKHLKCVVKCADQLLDAIAFNIDLSQWPNYHCEFVHMAYHLDVNEYRGRRSVQLLIRHLEPI
jgi:single-stranded-DNA-specific exonuclease